MKWMAVAIYSLFILCLSLITVKKVRTVEDFFLGNRSIGSWASAFAYGTTYFSAVVFIGYAGKVGWGFGLSSLWIAAGNAIIGGYLAWRLLARRTRELTTRLKALTMPEFLAARYDSPALQYVAAALIFIFLVPYSASVYMGLSYLIENIFGVPYLLALIVMALLTAFYLVMGGYFAVALVDLFQGLIMAFGAVLLVVFVTKSPQVGGLFTGLQRLAEINPGFTKIIGPPGFLPLFALVVLTSFGCWGLPQMVQKFYSVKNEDAIRRAQVITTTFALMIAGAAYYTGAWGRLFFSSLPLSQGRPNPDLIVPQMLQMILPEWGAALILLLVLSASMSTLSSLVLVSSSAVVVDIFKSLFPHWQENCFVGLMRFLCIVFIGLSLYLAVTPTIILVLMALSWGTLAGAFLGPYLYGLYWRRATRAGAWAGLLTGLAVSLGLAFYFKMDALWIPISGSLAMILPLAIVPLVSCLTKAFPESHLEKIFGARDEYREERGAEKGLSFLS
ncbi:MAG: sodium:solute symporter family protein [Firmicutes bacterium]|nr:sodium:solute symporter family protein [Bacillota bacterium]